MAAAELCVGSNFSCLKLEAKIKAYQSEKYVQLVRRLPNWNKDLSEDSSLSLLWRYLKSIIIMLIR